MNSPKNTSIYLTSKDSNHRIEKISASQKSIDSKQSYSLFVCTQIMFGQAD